MMMGIRENPHLMTMALDSLQGQGQEIPKENVGLKQKTCQLL